MLVIFQLVASAKLMAIQRFDRSSQCKVLLQLHRLEEWCKWCKARLDDQILQYQFQYYEPILYYEPISNSSISSTIGTTWNLDYYIKLCYVSKIVLGYKSMLTIASKIVGIQIETRPFQPAETISNLLVRRFKPIKPVRCRLSSRYPNDLTLSSKRITRSF